MSKYIEVSAAVRYWDDATVNGAQDDSGDLIPCKQGSYWVPVIRLADGVVMDWPQGTTAEIHYKVCDAGEYWLQDENRKRIAKYAGDYVPNDFLAPGASGYGDYIILKVGPNGAIDGWRKPAIEFACECDEDSESGWIRLPGAPA